MGKYDDHTVQQSWDTFKELYDNTALAMEVTSGSPVRKHNLVMKFLYTQAGFDSEREYLETVLLPPHVSPLESLRNQYLDELSDLITQDRSQARNTAPYLTLLSRYIHEMGHACGLDDMQTTRHTVWELMRRWEDDTRPCTESDLSQMILIMTAPRNRPVLVKGSDE